MAEDLRVAVVGVGGMGSNHARVLAGMKGVRLVGVQDHDSERAAAVAGAHACAALPSLDAVIDQAEAVSVAVPSSLHAEVAGRLLEAGRHCLIEKPFVTVEADGVALVEAAARSGARVLVGHIERFNPAVTQLAHILAGDQRVLAVDARRMSAVSGRITDVDVVSDLMVHDIDIVLDLVPETLVELEARAVRGPNGGIDHVVALLGFDGGAMASLTASRITQNQVRALQVTTEQRFFTLDYPNQELLIYRQGRIGGLDGDGDASRYVLDVGTERVFVRRVEPLVTEMQHFVDVARGEVEPLVSAAQALAAMRVVWSIQAAVQGTAQ